MLSLLLVVLVVGIGTYVIRAVSLVWGSHIAWPAWAETWLSFVTPAVLGALLGPLILLPAGHWLLPWRNPTLLASVPTVLVAWFTRNLLLTVFVGVVAFALLSILTA